MVGIRAGERLIGSGLVLAGVVMLSTAAATAGDWPRYRGANHDGISSETIVWPPTEIWRANVGWGYSQVTVSQGRVYTMGWSSSSGDDTVYCFDEGSTGNDPAPLWTHSYACSSSGDGGYSGTRATPTVDGNEVYTLSHQGNLYCFNKVSGGVLWNKLVNSGRPGWAFAGSPLIDNVKNLVILNVGGSGTAVDKNSPHNVIWNHAGTAGHASPMPFTWNSQRTVAIFDADEVVGVDPDGGAVRWSYPWSGASTNAADPIVSGDYVFISTGYTKGCARLNLGSGTLTTNWYKDCSGDAADGIRNKENCSVLYTGYRYGINDGGQLRCVDWATGNIQWSQGGFGTEGSVMIAGGELVAMSSSGDLVIVQASSAAYNELHRQDNILGGDTWTCPVVANGKLYIRSHQGTLVCFDVGGGVPTVAITIATSPSGRAITVDTTSYTAPQTFNWTESSNHTLSVSSPQGSSGTRHVYSSWSNGGNRTQTYTVPSSAATVTANFTTQYQLTTAVDPPGAGSVSPASGSWYNSGTSVSVQATKNSGYSFENWTGALSGAANPQNLTMSAPRSVTAHFGDDGDGDGLPDWWELEHFGDTSAYDGNDDPDNDNLDNIGEFAAGTDPTDDDTDDDGVLDGDDPTPLEPPSSFLGVSGNCAGGGLGSAALLLLLLLRRRRRN